MKYPNAKVIQFAKAPVAGTVKTRLQPMLGQDGALLLHKELVKRVFAQCIQADVACYELSVAGDSRHAFFRTFTDSRLEVTLQSGQDLGLRMADAVCRALKTYQFAIIIGSDCPAMDAAYIESACGVLTEGAQVVIGPAEDGGYVLIGMRLVEPAIFQDIEWGTDQVLAQTLGQLGRHELKWEVLPTLWDVDRPGDLARYNSLAL